MKMVKYIKKSFIILNLFTLILLNPFNFLNAQEDFGETTSPSLVLLSKAYSDSVALRWASSSFAKWRIFNEKGYSIERAEVSENKELEWIRLNDQPIKPIPIEEWQKNFDKDDSLEIAAMQVIYGQTIATNNDPFGALIELNKQENILYGFGLLIADMSPELANKMAVRFVDKDIKKGSKYFYRIIPNSEEEKDTAYSICDLSFIEPPKTIQSLNVEEMELEIILLWDKDEFVTPFSGYFIEQSKDGGKTFSRLNSKPLIFGENPGDQNTISDYYSYNVKLDKNYLPYSYRVLGFDAFGDLSESKIIIAMGRDRTSPNAPVLYQPEIVNKNSFKLTWKIIGDEKDKDLDGFFIAKSREIDADYEIVSNKLSNNIFEYIDVPENDFIPNYYSVIAVDTAGNAISSLPVLAVFPDSIPPLTPIGLSGIIDSLGIVKLSWNSNSEDDLMGYRVFYANQKDHEFIQLTGQILSDTLYVDSLTLKTLSEEIYYKVAALDYNYNHSPFTDVLTLKKPDIITPSSPQITDIQYDNKMIKIYWIPSSSGDVVKHFVYRKSDNDSDYVAIKSYENSNLISPQNIFVDSSAVEDNYYEYYFVALDDDGLFSAPSNIISARLASNPILETVTDLNTSFDLDNNQIKISWQSVENAEYFIIYRKINDSNFIAIDNIDGNQRAFIEKNPIKGYSYNYGIKAVKGNRESDIKFGETLIIR